MAGWMRFWRFAAVFVVTSVGVALPPSAAAAAHEGSQLVAACVGSDGVIRVQTHCARDARAIGLQIVPLARAAVERPASAVIRPHSITGQQVKPGSLPGSDITPGTLPAAALSRRSVGSGLQLAGGVLKAPSDAALQARVTALESKVSALQALLVGVTRNGRTLLFSGMNLQLESGSGATEGPVNGLGNLVIGYNENPGSQTGSHNLVLGDGQSFTSYGGLVGGQSNVASGPFAAVFGKRNTASAANSSVTGGEFNLATAPYASVNGGCSGIAGPGSLSIDLSCINFTPGLGQFATVSGGVGNHATGNDAAVLGGYVNAAAGIESTVSGGALGTAGGTDAAVSGGDGNQATGDESSISGGESNIAGDPFSAIQGGCDNITGGGTLPSGGCSGSGLESVTGGKSNRANDLWASVSGGCDNLAGAYVSLANGCSVSNKFTGAESVSGGENNWAKTALSSVSGGQSNRAVGFSSSIGGGVANESDQDWGSILGGSHETLSTSAAQAASEAGPTIFAP